MIIIIYFLLEFVMHMQLEILKDCLIFTKLRQICAAI